jgi:hypothetical protein
METIEGCIFCKSTTNSFNSIEHIFPESLGNKEKILDKGFVCDTCNNEVLSGLDAELLDFEGIKFMRTFKGIENKKGKVPVSNFPNLKIENPDKNHVQIHLQTMKHVRDQSDTGFKLDFRGTRKMDAKRLKLLARSLYKIAYELVCLDHGRDFVLSPRFDEVRDIILGKKDFTGYLCLGSNEKSENPRVTYYLRKDETGKDVTVVDFNYLFVRIIFDIERRTIPFENGFKIDRLTILKW